MEHTSNQERVVHVRFEGRSWDLSFRVLGVGDHSSDDDIRRVLSQRLDVSVGKLGLYVIERHDNGNITVRPEAVFG